MKDTGVSLQEILDLRGYIVIASGREFSAGDVVDNVWDSITESEFKISVKSVTDRDDFLEQCLLFKTPCIAPRYHHFYRALAE